jgi:hypothetical protein
MVAGTLHLVGPLILNGTLPRCGSLLYRGILEACGSLKELGALIHSGPLWLCRDLRKAQEYFRLDALSSRIARGGIISFETSTKIPRSVATRTAELSSVVNSGMRSRRFSIHDGNRGHIVCCQQKLTL